MRIGPSERDKRQTGMPKKQRKLLGRYLGAWENPDYHEQPGEKPEESPDV